MKKVFSLFLCFVMVLGIMTSVPLTVNAASVDDLTFALNDDGESYSVVGCSESASGSLTIPAKYKSKPVTAIGHYAFHDCKKLTSITVPDSVTDIGSSAFENCTGITEITFSDSLKYIDERAFFNCKGLTLIKIPVGVKSIGYAAFYDCTSLSSIKIPDSVKSIERDAFYNTAYYNKTANWENGVLYINNHLIKAQDSISGNYTIKDKTKTIASFAFAYCTNLTSINMPDSIKHIGDGAFYSCTSITEITIPNSVKSIDFCAFEDCTNLVSITLPNSIKSIEYGTFARCTNLDSITLPNSIKSIGEDAFAGCTKLKAITIPDSVKVIACYAFSNCTKLKTAKIGNSVTTIGYKAFGKCTSLSEVTIPDSVKIIEEGAFFGCSGLTKINVSKNNSKYASSNGVLFNKDKTLLILYPQNKASSVYKIPAGVKTIKSEAFRGCKKVTTVEIPGSVKEIYNDAFLGCANLKTIKLHYGINSIGANAFWGCKNLKSVKIPASVKEIGSHAFGYYYNETHEWVKVKNFKIYGRKGSSAQQYAKENGFTFVAVTAPSKTKLKTVENTSTGVKLTWNKITKADYYEIYRKVKGGSYKCIGTTTSTSYTDKTAKTGKTYYYVIKSVNSAGKAAASNALSIKFLAVPTIKSISTAKAGVAIKWSKVAGATGYQVYRKTGSGKYGKVATIKKGTTVSYLDKSASKGKIYTYRVRAYSGKTTSALSNTKNIKDKY